SESTSRSSINRVSLPMVWGFFFLILASSVMMRPSIDSLWSIEPPIRLRKSFEHQARIVAAEPEGVGERRANVAFPGLVRRVVQIALRVGVFMVDRRMKNFALQSERAHNRLDRARGAQAVADHGFGRIERDPARARAKQFFDRVGFGPIVQDRRSPVSVD